MKYHHLITSWLLFTGILVTVVAIVIKCNPPASPPHATFYCANYSRLCYTADKASGYDVVGGYFAASSAYCTDGYTYTRGGGYELFRHCYPSVPECDSWADEKHLGDSVAGTKKSCTQRLPNEGGTGRLFDIDQGHL